MICVIFILPTSFATDANRDDYSWIENFNFTGPMVLACTIFFMGWYYADARTWFKGPSIAKLDVKII